MGNHSHGCDPTECKKKKVVNQYMRRAQRQQEFLQLPTKHLMFLTKTQFNLQCQKNKHFWLVSREQQHNPPDAFLSA